MKTCDSCRFFGTQMGVDGFDPETDEEFTTGHHACARIIHGNGSSEGYERSKVELAVVTDGSGYAARLQVLPTFGCVLHELKEAPDASR